MTETPQGPWSPPPYLLLRQTDPWSVPGGVDPRWAPPGSVLPASTPGRGQGGIPGWVVAVAVLVVSVLGIGGVLGVARSIVHHASRTDAKAPTTTVPSTPVEVQVYPPGPPPGRVVVTGEMADQVLRQFWPVHSQALYDRDLARLASLSDGSARRWEIGAVSCRCLVSDNVRPLLEAVYYVPRQTTYPARFIAEAHTDYGDGEEGLELLTFSRSGPQAPWYVIESSFFTPLNGPVQLTVPDVTKGGFTGPVSSATRARARSIARQFAAVWQMTKNTGQIPAVAARSFRLGGQPGDRLAQLAEHAQDTVQRNGLIGHFTYYTTKADPLVVVRLAQDLVLACQPIHGDITYRPQRGHVVHQDDAQVNWGLNVKPGNYRAIKLKQEWQTCFVIRDTPGVPVSVLNNDVGGGTFTAIR